MKNGYKDLLCKISDEAAKELEEINDTYSDISIEFDTEEWLERHERAMVLIDLILAGA